MLHRRGGRENPDVSEDIMPTIDTRADCFGVCVVANYSPSGHSAARVVSPGGDSPNGHGESWDGHGDCRGGQG